MRKLFVVVAAIAAVWAAIAEAQEIGDTAEGQAYAERVCAECHAVLPGQADSPKAEATPFEAVAKTPGMTATALFVHLQTSHQTMPNFVIEPDDRQNIVAYILGLNR